MGARSYIPQLGRYLQTDPRPGGSENQYAYTYGDPVNTFDFSGEYTVGGPSQALLDSTEEWAAKAVTEQIAINTAVREEAEHKAAEAEAQYARAMMLNESPEGDSYSEEEWGEEEYWEEEGEEYASYHPHAGNKGEAHLESGVLYQPLSGAERGGEHGSSSTNEWFRVMVGLPKAGECNNSECGGEKQAHRASSRCAQYGGHWQGHTCVGVPHHGGGINITCGDVGGAVGGAAGAAAGGAVGDAPGAYVGGAAGGVAGSHLAEKICH